jgi:DNA-binding transcriptional ArsR family regulator
MASHRAFSTGVTAGRATRSPPIPRTNSKSAASLRSGDVDSFSRVLWWLFSSSAGAATRARIVAAVRSEPKNAQQLANDLSLDYTTVRHHLKVLRENYLVETTGEHYGQVYSLAPSLEGRWAELESIVRRHRKE